MHHCGRLPAVAASAYDAPTWPCSSLPLIRGGLQAKARPWVNIHMDETNGMIMQHVGNINSDSLPLRHISPFDIVSWAFISVMIVYAFCSENAQHLERILAL